ncbi:hypothetical protein VNO77_43899 [Canavalia gladiata]|uniref:Uncharacterized protein n=1 Tax=Canavalia gladiata TaxID=3824 RepID=A0AAN9JUY7_CANGL
MKVDKLSRDALHGLGTRAHPDIICPHKSENSQMHDLILRIVPYKASRFGSQRTSLAKGCPLKLPRGFPLDLAYLYLVLRSTVIHCSDSKGVALHQGELLREALPMAVEFLWHARMEGQGLTVMSLEVPGLIWWFLPLARLSIHYEAHMTNGMLRPIHAY